MKYNTLQFRRIKKFNNGFNLIEVAYLKRWDRQDQGKQLTQSPLQDEIDDFDSVEWKFMGTITLSDADWVSFKASAPTPLCYFTDDFKEK